MHSAYSLMVFLEHYTGPEDYDEIWWRFVARILDLIDQLPENGDFQIKASHDLYRMARTEKVRARFARSKRMKRVFYHAIKRQRGNREVQWALRRAWTRIFRPHSVETQR